MRRLRVLGSDERRTKSTCERAPNGESHHQPVPITRRASVSAAPDPSEEEGPVGVKRYDEPQEGAALTPPNAPVPLCGRTNDSDVLHQDDLGVKNGQDSGSCGLAGNARSKPLIDRLVRC